MRWRLLVVLTEAQWEWEWPVEDWYPQLVDPDEFDAILEPFPEGPDDEGIDVDNPGAPPSDVDWLPLGPGHLPLGDPRVPIDVDIPLIPDIRIDVRDTWTEPEEDEVDETSSWPSLDITDTEGQTTWSWGTYSGPIAPDEKSRPAPKKTSGETEEVTTEVVPTAKGTSGITIKDNLSSGKQLTTNGIPSSSNAMHTSLTDPAIEQMTQQTTADEMRKMPVSEPIRTTTTQPPFPTIVERTRPEKSLELTTGFVSTRFGSIGSDAIGPWDSTAIETTTAESTAVPVVTSTNRHSDSSSYTTAPLSTTSAPATVDLSNSPPASTWPQKAVESTTQSPVTSWPITTQWPTGTHESTPVGYTTNWTSSLPTDVFSSLGSSTKTPSTSKASLPLFDHHTSSNVPLTEHTLSRSTLTESTLTETTLTTLPESNLTEATLPEATLPEATLPEATLPEATLPEATLTEATLTEATLTEATLTEATLTEATLTEATLTEATLPEAT
ncbi:pentapeptide repeat protein, partial [Gregarina niphandrodes]